MININILVLVLIPKYLQLVIPKEGWIPKILIWFENKC